MKRFMAFLVVLVSLCITHWAYGSDNFEVDIFAYKTIPLYNDSEGVVQDGYGTQVSFLYKGVFGIYVSNDITPLRYAGQSGVNLDIKSIGLVLQKKFENGIKVGLDFGWYEPNFSGMGELQSGNSSPFTEGLCRYMNKFLAPDDSYPAWDNYSLDFQGAIGAKFRFNYEYSLTEWLLFDISLGIRYLNLIENVKGKHDPIARNDDFWVNNYWTIKFKRSFTTAQIGAGIKILF